MKQKKNKPKVSVVIPSYNYGCFLKEAVISVAKQTYKDWECLIIDDGSTDNTTKISKEFVKKNKKIKYFYQKNKGLSSARNLGIKKSKGELIAFLDADDIWHPDKLKEQVKVMEQKKNVGLCCSYAETIDKDSKLLMRWQELKAFKKYQLKINTKLLCQGNFILGPSSVISSTDDATGRW